MTDATPSCPHCSKILPPRGRICRSCGWHIEPRDLRDYRSAEEDGLALGCFTVLLVSLTIGGSLAIVYYWPNIMEWIG